MPCFTNSTVENVSGAALTYTMKKFINDPALITFLGSINIAFNFMVAPFIAWKSDRIWTRFGRRKPFVICGWIGLIISLLFVPLAPNIWALSVAIVVYQFFQDFAFTGPYEPLEWEVVPLPQRGRAAATNAFMNNCAGLYFNFFMIKHFHEVYNLRINLDFLWPRAEAGGASCLTITGEQIIYWGAAALVSVMLAHVCLNIKETPVHSVLMGERFSMKRYLKGVFGERQWLLIYLLIFSQISMNQGLAQLSPLLITEQFHYSMNVLGNIGGLTTALRIIILVPIAGYLSDKMDRLRLYQIGLLVSACHPISYWCFVKFIAANHVPSAQAIVGFEIFGSFVHVMGNITLAPLLFDFVPRDKMGTAFGGMTLARGMVKLTVNFGVGIWVSLYSRLFMPKGQYDYMSGYLYVFMIGVFGCLASFYFASERKKGRVIAHGRIEIENESRGT